MFRVSPQGQSAPYSRCLPTAKAETVPVGFCFAGEQIWLEFWIEQERSTVIGLLFLFMTEKNHILDGFAVVFVA
jgi:hypothetical protein